MLFVNHPTPIGLVGILLFLLGIHCLFDYGEHFGVGFVSDDVIPTAKFFNFNFLASI